MKVIPSRHTKLIAYCDGQIIDIPNMVLRKPADTTWQHRNLSDKSICITCNYVFRDQPMLWTDRILAICHPFRSSSLPQNKKLILFSESDFCDALTTPVHKKSNLDHYDFVYFTINSLQGIECKGLYLLRAISMAAKLTGLRGIVLNYGPPIEKFNSKNKRTPEFALNRVRKYMKKLPNIVIKNKLLSNQGVCDVMLHSKFVLFPNTKDASPRLIPESIVRNVPALVNENIYGGWKYINENTGMMFKAPQLSDCYEKDWDRKEELFAVELADKFRLMSNFNNSAVSESYYKEYGFKNSCIRLASIINEISNKKYQYVCYKEFATVLKRII